MLFVGSELLGQHFRQQLNLFFTPLGRGPKLSFKRAAIPEFVPFIFPSSRLEQCAQPRRFAQSNH